MSYSKRLCWVAGCFFAALLISAFSTAEEQKENAIRHVHDPCIIQERDKAHQD